MMRVSAIALAFLAVAVVPAASASRRRVAHAGATHRQIRQRWPLTRLSPALVPAARALLSAANRRPHIVGGSGGVQGDWPFMAFIVHYDAVGNPDFSCSGTLVSENVVLTAGHCAADETTGAALDPTSYRVVTGAVDWTDTTNRQVSTVSQVIVDPTFDPGGPMNDAALLVLSSPLTDAPIPLWSSGGLSAGTPAWIAGWGATYSGQTTLQALLQWAPIVVQSVSYCEQPFFPGYPYDSSTDLCAVNAPTYDTGTCQGDSGGPLLAHDVNGNLFEIGLTSIGPANCNTQQPGYYTAILPIESWVQSEASAVAPLGSPSSTPSGSAPAPSAPSAPSSSGSSSAGPTPPTPPPPMTFADARSYVRQVLAHLFARFRNEHALKLTCARLSAIRVRCDFGFWAGPNDYWGSVWVHYDTGTDGTTYWASRYQTQFVNDHCYWHTNHPSSCAAHRRAGTW